MIHTNMPRNCTIFLLRHKETRSAILWSQHDDSIKWPTVLDCDVKGKPCNFKLCLYGSLYSTFKASF